MDFFMNQLSIILDANCQLIQCTQITDLLSNLKGLLDSMIIKVFIVMQISHVSRRAKIIKHLLAVAWYTTSTCVTTITLLATLKEL